MSVCQKPPNICKKHGIYWPDECPSCVRDKFFNKNKQTINIDEMLEYKNKVDNLIDGYSGLNHEVKWAYERIEKLEIYMRMEDRISASNVLISLTKLEEKIANLETHKNYQIDENRKAFRHVEELEKRIEELESVLFKSSEGSIPESKL